MSNEIIEKNGDFSIQELFNPSNLLKPEDAEFLKSHASKFEHRFATRSLFRSRFEMEASVLNEDVHPTPDSKYWQAIGEQNVHITELISLSFSSKKLLKEIELLEIDIARIDLNIEEVEDILRELKPLAFPGNSMDLKKDKLNDMKNASRDHRYNELKLNSLKIEKDKINIDLEEKRFGLKQQDKTAQERMREIREWEEIIKTLHSQLEFGDEDFQKHHAKRYMLRYERKVKNLGLIDPSARDNAVSHYLSMASHPDNRKDVTESLKRIGNDSVLGEVQERINLEKHTLALPEETPVQIEQADTTKHDVKKQRQIKSKNLDGNYKSREDAMNADPTLKSFFLRKTKSILVVSPHRNATDQLGFDIFKMQPPSTVECRLYEPRGYSVSEARTLAVEKALKEGFDYIFQIDDDLIVPRNVLVQLYHHNTDIVGGFYYRKYLPLESVGMIEVEDNGVLVPSRIAGFRVGDVLHNTLVLPSGCSLIRTEVFRNITKPWYRTVTIEGAPAVTEDTYFCQKARDVGYDIVTDTGVQCLHVDEQSGRAFGHPDFIDNVSSMVKDLNYFCLYDYMIKNAVERQQKKS